MNAITAKPEYFDIRKVTFEDLLHNMIQTESNVPAYDFYRKRGFVELKNHVSFFKDLRKKLN